MIQTKTNNDKKIISKHIFDEMQYHDKNSKIYIKQSKKDLIWHVPEKLIFFDKYLVKNKNWSLLDVGCGPAENINRNLFKTSHRNVYVGIDISKKLINMAKKNIPTGIFINSPMSDLKLQKEAFDFICFFGSLHHDEFPQKSLGKISKLLKPNGLVFMREPHKKAFKKGAGASPHEAGLDPNKVKQWLTKLNFEIIEWHLLNSIPFHFIRNILVKTRLKSWENITFLWKIKVKTELLTEKLIDRLVPTFTGTDMFIVARKKN